MEENQGVTMEQEKEKNPLPEFFEGMRVEVLTPDNNLIFMGLVEAPMSGGVLEISQVDGHRIPPILYNSVIKLRGFQRNKGPFTVNATICGCTEFFWKLDRMEVLHTREQRAFFRQGTNIGAQVMCVNSIFEPSRAIQQNAEQQIPCRILDISGGGMRLRCTQKYAPGDWLFLMGVTMGGEDFSFTCRIRRAEEVERGHFEYGCQFEGLSDQEREDILRGVLELQKEERRARRDLGG